MAHAANCSVTWGAQIGTSPDFTEASFVAAASCLDFTAQEMMPTYAVQVLFTGLVAGQTYYYVTGTEGRETWSRVCEVVSPAHKLALSRSPSPYCSLRSHRFLRVPRRVLTHFWAYLRSAC